MDENRSRATQGYLETRVRGASPAELVSLLYEGLAREVGAASRAIDRADVAARCTAIGRSLGIVGHLRTSLNHEAGGAVATNLERLYVYWTARLTDANITGDRAPLDEIASHVEAVRAAWNESTRGLGQEAAAVATTASPPRSVARQGSR